MTCPICGGKTAVIDSAADFDSVYRKRKCLECSHKFVTTELEGDYDEQQILSRLRAKADSEEIRRREVQRKGEKLGIILKSIVDWFGFEFVGKVHIRHRKSREEIAL